MNDDEISGRLYVLEQVIADLLVQHLKEFSAEAKAPEVFLARMSKAIEAGGTGMSEGAMKSAMETLNRLVAPAVLNSIHAK
jgi:hypothetical protein